MEQREKYEVEREARNRAGDPHRSVGHGRDVSRYLGALLYLDERARDRAPADEARPAPGER